MFPSTANLVALLLLARSHADSTRVIATTIQRPADGRPGRDSTPKATGDTVKRNKWEVTVFLSNIAAITLCLHTALILFFMKTLREVDPLLRAY